MKSKIKIFYIIIFFFFDIITCILLWIFLRLIAHHVSIYIFKFFVNLLIFLQYILYSIVKRENFVLNEINITYRHEYFALSNAKLNFLPRVSFNKYSYISTFVFILDFKIIH